MLLIFQFLLSLDCIVLPAGLFGTQIHLLSVDSYPVTIQTRQALQWWKSSSDRH